MTEKPHPGISMHKLPVGGGFIGLVFAVGSALLFLLGLPALWYFVVFSAALGIGIALMMRISSARRSDRAKPLSILSARETRCMNRDQPRANGTCSARHRHFFRHSFAEGR